GNETPSEKPENNKENEQPKPNDAPKQEEPQEKHPPATSNDKPVTDQNEEQLSGQVVYHTVQKGETLYRISMKYFKSQEGIELIRKENGIAGNEINEGQKLKIPLQ